LANALLIDEPLNKRARSRITPARRPRSYGPFFHLAQPGRANAQQRPVRWVSMNIEKAVVVATDCRGSELWPSLGLSSRHLAPVANKPVLFHHLDSLSRAGIRETAIVTDRTTSAGIREAVGGGSSWNLDVRYVDGVATRTILSSVAVARFVGSDPVVVQHGDVLLREKLSTLHAQFADDELDALVMHAGNWSPGKRNGAPSIDCYLIGPGMYSALRAQVARRRSAGFGAALSGLRVTGARIQECDVEACLPCRGGTAALLEANRKVLEEMVGVRSGAERVFDSEIQGRVSLHPSAEVRDSLIRGPVAIGPRASITKAYIGPYTSIGADVTIESVEVEHSIVLEGAQISFLGARLEDSIVGPRASITRAFRVPRALRLSVGGGAEIVMD
jgi:glucose-1-phosphate thymidylyltransferase